MKRPLVTAYILLFTLRMAFCQEVLTLDAAIATGLANNYGINIAKKSLDIAKNNATPGNAGMLPKIDANAGYSHSLSSAKVDVTSGSELDNSSANTDNFIAGINLNWTLFDGMKMFITYDKLKKLEEAGDLSSKITVENTLARIIATYYDILRQSKITEIMIDQVEISKFRLELAKLRYETGSGSELEYLKARVELNADVANLSSQRTVYENSLASLNELMARDVKLKFEVRDTILLNYQLNYDSLRASMRESNRNLLLSNRNREISGLNMKTARAVQWPTLGLTTGINYLNLQTEANFISYNRNLGAIVGVSAYMNIFNGLNLQREYRNTKLSYESSELEIRQLENKLDAQLLRIHNDYLNQLELITFEKENIALANKNMEIAKESFAVGSISSLQLREIQKNLLDANTRLVDAEFKTKLTETALLLISGKLLH